MTNTTLLIKEITGKGRGVVANIKHSIGDIIEECPLVIIENDAAEYPHIEKTILDTYMYDWAGRGAVVLGYGWIYNHSYTPNAIYERDFNRKLMVYRAIKDISSGEEITVNYNGTPDSLDPIDWFTVVN